MKKALLETSAVADTVRKELVRKGLKRVGLFDWKKEADKLHQKLVENS